MGFCKKTSFFDITKDMKKLLTILCLLILVSCSPTPEIPPIELVVKQGIVYEVNSTTPFTGSDVSYYENGQLKRKGNFIDGKEDGLHESYYENGQLDFRGNYKNGEEEGLFEQYYDNGQLEMRGNFIDGKEDGLKESYYDEGQLKVRGNFIDGKMVGLFEVYNENGQLE
ncbi:uncharacterized protein METZ01_LOCUS490917, partial [marine metagenome]